MGAIVVALTKFAGCFYSTKRGRLPPNPREYLEKYERKGGVLAFEGRDTGQIFALHPFKKRAASG